MGAYKRLALISLALWALSTGVRAFVTAMNDTLRAELDAMLVDLDTVKGERRLILVGSSNVLHGLSASRFAEVSGIPARNVGVAGARGGFDEYFRIVIDRVQRGDVVLVSPSIRIVIDAGSRPYACKDPSSVGCLVDKWSAAPDLLQLTRERAYNSPWPRRRTDQGDVIFDTGTPSPNAARMPKPRFSHSSVAIVRRQIEMIHARGACAVIAFPPKLVLEDARAEWELEFARALSDFKAAGLDDMLVGSMMVHTNSGYFLNDVDHASAAGRDAWTQMVVKDLQRTRRCGMTWDAKRKG